MNYGLVTFILIHFYLGIAIVAYVLFKSNVNKKKEIEDEIEDVDDPYRTKDTFKTK